MEKYGRFSKYVPDGSDEGTLFLKNENDEDWYETYAWVCGKGKYIVVNDDNDIISYSEDISQLTPVDSVVFNIEDLTNIPSNFDSFFYNYKFINGEFINTHHLIESVKNKKHDILNSIKNEIDILNYTNEIDSMTCEENERLQYLKKYIVFINRINPDDYPNIKWDMD